VSLDHDDFDGWVGLLADPVRGRQAYWHLVLSGADALPTIRRGLDSYSVEARRYCAKALDHLVDEDAYPQLIAMLGDDDDQVRDACRPEKTDVLPQAIRLLLHDRNKYARAMAVEVVGRWAHVDESAALALARARDEDPEPSVRKKGGWYAPGGTIYRKTTPRAARR
jgi:HEAT repeat protein